MDHPEGVPPPIGEDGVEAALARVEAETVEVLKSAAAAVRELRAASVAARLGTLRELRRALGAARQQAAVLVERAAELESGFALDEEQLLGSGAYAKELLATAAAAGVAMFEEDGQLLCYPALLRVLPGEAAVTVDRRRERRLRPSVLVRLLGARQRRGPRFKAEPFLASLAAAYDLLVARDRLAPGAVVRLAAVHRTLTLLPGQARDYPLAEFARDLYLLDQSQLVTARDGRRLRWAASTGTRMSGVLTTVAQTGQRQRYWGVAFEGGGR